MFFYLIESVFTFPNIQINYKSIKKTTTFTGNHIVCSTIYYIVPQSKHSSGRSDVLDWGTHGMRTFDLRELHFRKATKWMRVQMLLCTIQPAG